MRDRLVTRPLTAEWNTEFFQQPCELTDEVRAEIRELDEASARLVWNELIRRNQYLHPKLLPRHHWSRHATAVGPDWVAVWNRWIQREPGADPIPEFLRTAVLWSSKVPVLFVTHRDRALLTNWGTFLAAWQHFMYSDEGPLLVSWERPEFVAWDVGGFVGVGVRSQMYAEQAAAPDRDGE